MSDLKEAATQPSSQPAILEPSQCVSMPRAEQDVELQIKRAQFRLEKIKLLVTAAIALGGIWLFIRFDSLLKQADVADATGHFVAIEGEVRPPESFRTINGQQFAICPVVVTVSNAGRASLTVKGIEFRVFRALPENVVKLDVPDASQIILAGGSAEPDTTAAYGVGMLDIQSGNWNEMHSLRKSFDIPQEIRRDQQRVKTFHLLVAVGRDDFIVKIEATIHPAANQNWNAETWVGLSKPEFCAPAPFPTGFSETEGATEAAPPPADLDRKK